MSKNRLAAGCAEGSRLMVAGEPRERDLAGLKNPDAKQPYQGQPAS